MKIKKYFFKFNKLIKISLDNIKNWKLKVINDFNFYKNIYRAIIDNFYKTIFYLLTKMFY